MTIVLRADGADLNLDACLEWIPARVLETTWRAGEAVRGKVLTTSGFTLLLADAVETPMAVARSELLPLLPQIKALRAGGCSIEVDYAIYVGTTAPFSARLSREFLQLLVEAGAELLVSAYPCSDDE